MQNMNSALKAAGPSPTDVVSTRVLVASTEQKDLVAAWDVFRSAFGDHEVPSTLMGTTVPGYDHQPAEIEAVAAVLD